MSLLDGGLQSWVEAGGQLSTDVPEVPVALAELSGHPRVRHDVGGWTEYGSLIDVPVARG